MKITIRDKVKAGFGGGYVPPNSAWIDRDGDLWFCDYAGDMLLFRPVSPTAVKSTPARNNLSTVYAPYRQVLLTEIIVEPVL